MEGNLSVEHTYWGVATAPMTITPDRLDIITTQIDLEDWLAESGPDHGAVDLSVVIPAYNEQLRLPHALIEMIDMLDSRSSRYEIIVVDDGSTDRTSETVRRFERLRPQVRLVRLPVNRGKGHAVRTGMLNAKGHRVLFADADGATPFGELVRLEQALDSGADVAIGSRAMASRDTRVRTVLHRRILGRVFNAWVNALLLPAYADTQCGFKLFTRPAAQFLFARQRSERFSFDVELLYIARKAELNIHEVPINWNNVPGSKVNLVVDAARMLRDVPVFRWRHRDVRPRDFASRQAVAAATSVAQSPVDSLAAPV
jgi:dolichyl-phosphate beta-glucosyltransferase